jgi:hypothetical protein
MIFLNFLVFIYLLFRSINSAPGCTINNGLCFSRCMNGDIRLLVSNNDTTIRVFSVPDLNLIDTLDFRTAVNHSKFNCFFLMCH